MADLGWDYLTARDKDAILDAVRGGRARGGPYHVEIHPADRCNIDCFFCSTAALRGTDEIPLSRFEKIIAELGRLGTRSIRLSGGGEPLFHRQIKNVLRAIRDAGIRIENLTTNGVLLGADVAEILTQICDKVTISLNTADATTWSEMMKSPARNFDRVVENARRLVALRQSHRSRKPLLNIQFLVWKRNYKSIPAMYALARSIGADTILFNGLAFLTPDQKMTADETAEMLRLYEEVLERDEFRWIEVIGSYEQDLTSEVTAIAERLASRRRANGLLSRLSALLRRRDASATEKIRHWLSMRRRHRLRRATAGLEDYCVIGWHSMVIRTTGEVAPCCILQGKRLGNVFTNSVRDVWYGDAYEEFRGELRDIIRRGSEWEASATHKTVAPMCAKKGDGACPILSTAYRADAAFFTGLAEAEKVLR